MTAEAKKEDTGFKYPDGTAIYVGDRVFIEGENHTGKVYARPGKNGGTRFFVTVHYSGDTQKQYALSSVKVRCRYYTDLKERREKEKATRISKAQRGVFVVGQLDYDHLEILSK